MNKNGIYLVILLLASWIILTEGFSVRTLVVGVLLSTCCVYYCYKFLPLSKISGIKPLRLVLYPFYLVGQIYLAGFLTIKLILSNSKVNIVDIKTNITNDFIKVILANSITLIPGTVSLDLKDDTLTVLWLREGKSGPEDLKNAEEIIKGNLERKLIKAQKA